MLAQSFDTILTIVSSGLCIVLALIVLYRERDSFVHRIFALGMTALAMEQVLGCASRCSVASESALNVQYFRFLAAGLLPGIWLSFTCRFGREHGRLDLVWRWLPISTFLATPLVVLLFPQSFFSGLPEFELGGGWFFSLGWSGKLFQFIFLLGSVLILVNLEKTFRIAVGRARWQVKYLLLGLGGFFIFRVYLCSQSLLFSVVDPRLELLSGGALMVAALLCSAALYRTRLLHFDLYFSPALLRRSLTLLIVSAYLIGVALVAELSDSFRWVQEIPIYSLIILLGLISAAALLMSERLHLFLRRFVSRQFGRPHHDYRSLWKRFTEQTTSVLEEGALARRTVGFVSKAMESPSVTLWMADERRRDLVFGASSSLTRLDAEKLHEDNRISKLVYGAMFNCTGIVDSEKSSPDWIVILGEMDSDYLSRSRIRYFVPLRIRDEFFGVMTLSDRVGRKGHSFEELELMQLLADQTAASLWNLKLALQVQRTKQVETLQHMSAFLLHDLKNLAQRFALTAENLTTNFDNPEYREQAVSVLRENVEKIRSICNDLTLLREKLELDQTQVDLNELVARTIDEMKESTRSLLVKDLQPLQPVVVDKVQLQKVLANLVLNADEASPEGGEIHISTDQVNGFAIISVRDNGCGMSEDFVEQRLFQPFQTTKKTGMGIGLYHSKMIVDLHGGEVEVESEVGRGTTFRVVLPIEKTRKSSP